MWIRILVFFIVIYRYLSAGKTKAAPKIKNRLITDTRIKVGNRDARRFKSLNFIKEGSIVKYADELRRKEARAQVSQSTIDQQEQEQEQQAQQAQQAQQEEEQKEKKEEETVDISPIQDPTALPPPNHYPAPEIEWWDYDFLPAEIAEEVKADRYMGDLSFDMLSIDNCITRE